MQKITVLMSLAVVGCASPPTLDELEATALATGDWSAVEKRERSLARRDGTGGVQCPTNTIKVCVHQVVELDCQCMQPVAFGSRH